MLYFILQNELSNKGWLEIVMQWEHYCKEVGHKDEVE